jgi:predicted enzyme related to lactoylglutathione lyase
MPIMPNVVFFEICVEDVERAAVFYERIFDWKIAKGDDSSYRFIETGENEGIGGALMTRVEELDSTINTIDVPSVDAVAKEIAAAGGKVMAPKIALEGVGYVQYCQDLDGNSFAIIEYDESAI